MMPRRLEHLASRAARPDIKLTKRHPGDIPVLVNPHRNTTTPLTTSSEWVVKRCHSRLHSHISLFWQKHLPSERSPEGDHEKISTAGRRTLRETLSSSSKCKTKRLTVNFRGFPHTSAERRLLTALSCQRKSPKWTWRCGKAAMWGKSNKLISGTQNSNLLLRCGYKCSECNLLMGFLTSILIQRQEFALLIA